MAKEEISFLSPTVRQSFLLGWVTCLVLVGMCQGDGVTPRIVGGSPASPGEYPYFIQWGGCGATLIHNDVALGAAHVSVESSIDPNLAL